LADRPCNVVLFEAFRLQPCELVVGPAQARRERRLVEALDGGRRRSYLHAARIVAIRAREEIVVDPDDQSVRVLAVRDRPCEQRGCQQ
jgi:hypothetical protein